MRYFILVLLLAGVGTFLFFSLKIVPEAEAYVIERLGSYNRTLYNGINIIIPFIDRVAKKVSLKEMMLDFPPQSVITKDNVMMEIDTVVYLQILNPKLFAYGVDNPLYATENLTATTIRNIIGTMDLQETLTSRDTINVQMKTTIDHATDPWGINIIRVEVKNILPPIEIQQAMEKQMKAEREKIEKILIAEAEKEFMIKTAEGQAQALRTRAEADKDAKILAAEAVAKEKMLMHDAEVYSIKIVNDAAPSDKFIQLESLKTMKEVANGNATKIIVPSNLQDLTGIINVIKDAK